MYISLPLHKKILISKIIKPILCKKKKKKKDTVNDAASLDVATFREVKLDEFPKTTGVVVVNSLRITKCFHDRTAKRIKICI